MRRFILAMGVLVMGCTANQDLGGGLSDEVDAGDAKAVDVALFGDAVGVSSCLPETQFVYTISADNTLRRFDPPSVTFTVVGTIACPHAGEPFSMAVDRRGTAWVLDTLGGLFRVDTRDASCASTAFVAGQHAFATFGMGFVSNSPGSEGETLFVSDSGEAVIDGGTGKEDGGGAPPELKGLARIDLTTLELLPVARYDALNVRAELTGTGDSRLFGAFLGSELVVAEIDRTSARIVSQAPQSGVAVGSGSEHWAVAFWGGDFWMFVGPTAVTDVYRYRPSTRETTHVGAQSFAVVGAGVSTCAPTQPPR